MRLSKAQRRALESLASGEWALWPAWRYASGVRKSTFNVLASRGFVRVDLDGVAMVYITDAGRKALASD